MSATNQPQPRRGRGRPPRVLPEGEVPGNARIMAAFRIPRSIHAEMLSESRQEGVDLTAYVNRLFDGFLHQFSLPSVVREGLESDREAMRFSRYEYIQYLLFRRYEDTAKNGPGFDKKNAK